MLSTSTLALSLFPLLTSAHFQLEWPEARGFEDRTAGDFPCGGFNDVSDERTPFPLSGGPIQLDLGHTETKLQVVLALGNDPGDAYNHVLVPTIQERGPENFCFGMVTFPDELNLTEGMNATIQVLSNGDPSGGLYQCADITFTSTPLSTTDYNDHCTNSSGIQVQPLEGGMNANESSSDGHSHSHPSASATESEASASTSTSTGLAAQMTPFVGYVVGALGVVGGLAAL
ncbi:hypothetical protein M501DRAFT_932828 [Patellaria atrata CBS 101060]|uniref:Copper acquisition factor BIM1-like domain-containing protein n=1 Tax=Patellaria atrata CBS 101060 TaxID=1346257 RepID=A0A9P4VRV3_9PEZI|nr:hypothetical protein M501DRAFT_932828 [Patellaria atrata CBS 101060]